MLVSLREGHCFDYYVHNSWFLGPTTEVPFNLATVAGSGNAQLNFKHLLSAMPPNPEPQLAP